MLSLDKLSEDVDLAVSLDSLAERLALRDHQLKSYVAAQILTLFSWSVGSTVAITILLALIDVGTLASGLIKPAERLVNEKILLALIGASVVQVGAASAAIAYGLFGRPTDLPAESDEPVGTDD